MTTNSDTLTEVSAKHLQGLRICLICARYGRPLSVGDPVTHKISRAKTRRLYHQSCYDSMFLNVPDGENEEEKT